MAPLVLRGVPVPRRNLTDLTGPRRALRAPPRHHTDRPSDRRVISPGSHWESTKPFPHPASHRDLAARLTGTSPTHAAVSPARQPTAATALPRLIDRPGGR